MLEKQNIYLWSKNIMAGQMIPLLWFSAKTYYEENGEKVDQWSWQEPFIHDQSDDYLFNCLEKNPPSIFGFSVYVWSYVDADIIAQKIKSLYPKCLIIYGGPQNDIKYSNDFFVKKPWVDFVVPSDVYGEPLLTHILDNFDELDPAKVPEIYYHKQGIKFRSRHEFIKREFKWPTNIFEAQKKHLVFDSKNSMAIYETNRGCPYRCIYCDWGGGTYTKVVRKPMETIYSELESLAKAGIEFLTFSDANFGIYKTDVDIIEFVGKLKQQYGYPKAVNLENAKNNLDRVIEIQKILIKNQLNWHYKVSTQNPDETVKNNIDRVDLPMDQYITAINDLKREYDAPILMETILGLPGDSYQLTLETIDIVYDNAFDTFRSNFWQLLPEAPAYDPTLRDKFQIKTKWFDAYTHPFRYKDDVEIDEGVRTLKQSMMSSENVISTYSYTSQEWCDMVAVTMLASTGKTLGIDFLVKYLKEAHGISAGEFFNEVYKNIVLTKKFNSIELNEKFGVVTKKLNEITVNNGTHKLEFDISPEFPFLLSIYLYIAFLVMLHPRSFYESIADYFAKKLSDDKIQDLGNYLASIMIDMDYNPETARTFNTKYNWYSYFDLNNQLTKGNYEYKILDKHLKLVAATGFEYSDYPDQTDYAQKMKQFFYHRASNQARKKYSQHIIESKL